MVVTARRMTADQFLALPPEPHTQLIDGTVVVGDPSLRHQRVLARLFGLLYLWVRTHPAQGEAGIGCNWRIDDDNVFIPDLWFCREGSRPGDVVAVDGAPDLVVEVRSPSTWRYDTGVKRAGYLDRGAEEVWLIDTEADQVAVCRHDGESVLGLGDTLTSPLLPGLAIDAGELFDR